MSLEPSLAPSSCTNFITVNEDTQEVGTLPNNFNSDYDPPMTCETGSGNESDSCQCVNHPTAYYLTNPGCTEFPVGGSGMVDEGFTMLTLPNGNQVGIRAAERNVGVTNVNPTAAGNGVGSYEVQAGGGSDPDDAWWNIGWHVDLRPSGDTIEDYQTDGVGLRMTAKCISGSCGSFGTYDFDLAPSTLDFGTGPFTYLGDDWNLLQASQNPDFNIWPWSPLYTGGSNEFDKYAEATYEFCLLLGDVCPVCMEVEVGNPPCDEMITVNENTQEVGTLPNNFNSYYDPPMTCETGSGNESDSCQCVNHPTAYYLTNPGCTEFPVGGSGMVDEGFTMLTLPNGNQVGIRAAERNVGVTNVNPTAAGNGVGSYEVQAGGGSDPDDAWWNIGWHVDLRPSGDTIEDYQTDGVGLRMTAKCISGSCGSFGTYDFDLAPSTLDFGTGPFTYLGDDWNLLQASQNPDFNIWPWSPLYTGGSNEFDKYAEATYEFCLLLGDVCPVCIEVVASNP